MSENFFHAYIVGGVREDTEPFIDNLISNNNKNKKDTFEIIKSEHVIFTIEHVRAFREWQQLRSLETKKIYVVFVAFMTNEAQNALLKTLEEPSENTHIIVSIPKPETLLQTILSRVQLLYVPQNKNNGVKNIKDFLNMGVGERLDYVKKICAKDEDEYASAKARERAVDFFNDLENYISYEIKKIDKNHAKHYEQILSLKKNLYTPSVSIKNILETVALVM